MELVLQLGKAGPASLGSVMDIWVCSDGLDWSGGPRDCSVSRRREGQARCMYKSAW